MAILQRPPFLCNQQQTITNRYEQRESSVRNLNVSCVGSVIAETNLMTEIQSRCISINTSLEVNRILFPFTIKHVT